MKIYFTFNIDRFKLYYRKISEIKKNQLEIVEEIKE